MQACCSVSFDLPPVGNGCQRVPSSLCVLLHCVAEQPVNDCQRLLMTANDCRMRGCTPPWAATTSMWLSRCTSAAPCRQAVPGLLAVTWAQGL